jgi:hypothetical protein
MSNVPKQLFVALKPPIQKGLICHAVGSRRLSTDEEAKNFWPLYDGYQKELEQINQRLFTTIKSYAGAYNAGKGEISNDIEKKIMPEALAADESEVKLRQSYAATLEKVLPAKKVARYLQIEMKIRAIVNFELASGIPLVS